MKKIIVIFFLFNTIYSSSILAQQNTFSKVYTTYTNSGNQVSAFVPSFDNSFVLAGTSDNTKGLVIKFDTLGNIRWSKKYSARFNGIVSTIDSCYLLIGSNSQFCTKIDSGGKVLWSKSIQSTNTYIALAAQKTLDNGFVITGYSYPSAADTYSIFVAKLSSNASLEWKKEYASGSDMNIGYSVKQTPDSGYVVTGSLESLSPLTTCIFSLKLSASGSIEWSRKYNNPLGTFFNGNDVVVLNNELFFYVDIDGRIGLIKTDIKGNIIWLKIYDYINGGGGMLGDVSPKIHPTHDGGWVFVHGSSSESAVMKVDSIGKVVFNWMIFGITVDLAECGDNRYMIIGNGPLIGSKSWYPFSEIGIIKTDSVGRGTPCISSAMETIITNIGLIADTCIFLTSMEDTLTSISAVADTISISSKTGCVDASGGIKKNQLSDALVIYPIPSQSIVTVESDNIIEFFELRDISGKVLLSGKNNSSQFLIDLGNYAQGVYIISVHQQNKLIFRKIIKE
jgi:hypothetical protein